MQIVLPGALPDASAARELIPYVLKAAPTLVRWFEQSRANLLTVNTSITGCTPYEAWLLKFNGFTPKNGQNTSAGLGPLWAKNVTSDEHAVWLTELVHLSPSRDGAALLPARELHITPEQSLSLLESAQTLFQGTGFALHPDATEHWGISLPQDFTPLCASPGLVSISSVNDWWPQDDQSRPWRRLMNELQMLWFDHPVNQQRYDQGQLPINSLWLFGGADANQINKLDPALLHTYNDLAAYSLAQDWGGWINALTQMETNVFQPLAGQQLSPDIALIGREKIIEIKPNPLWTLTKWLPRSRDAWRKWWSHQN